MQAVNLLPAYARPAGRWASLGSELTPASVARMGGAIAAACAIAVTAGYFYERSVVNDRRATLADAESRLTAVEATAAPLRAAQAARAARIQMVTTVSHSRIAWETVLGGLSRVLPDQVYLSSLIVASPTAAAPVGTAAVATPGASGFTVSGLANSQNTVALVLDRLALLPWLSNVTLQSSTSGAGAGGSAGDQFAITAGFTAPSTAAGAQ
jgi:Tfp pilus assembly protein PilN